MNGTSIGAAVAILTFLEENDGSANDIVVMCHLNLGTVLRWLRELHKAKLVHITEWRRTAYNNPCIAVYSWGRKKDAVRPPKLTQAQRQSRLRKKKDAERVLGRPIHLPPARMQ